jgi:hypothetical protein
MTDADWLVEWLDSVEFMITPGPRRDDFHKARERMGRVVEEMAATCLDLQGASGEVTALSARQLLLEAEIATLRQRIEEL